MAGHELVVAGQHLHGDAGGRHRLDRRAGACFGRIEEDSEAGEDEVGLVGHRRGRMTAIDRASGYAECAESFRAERVEGGLENAARCCVERPLHPVRVLVSPAQPQQVLRRALDDQATPGVVLDQDRDTPPLEIERHFVDLPPACHVERMGGEDRLVERALHAALEPAVDVGIGVGPLTVGTAPVDRADQLDRRFRQRAGLVGAQDVHGAEIVDRGEALHDHLSLGQLHRRPGERHRHDHRQQLGRQSDRERQREHQRLQHRPLERDVHHQDEQHHQHGQPHDQHAETANADREGGGRRLFRQARREMAERRPAAGSADDDGCGAADHGCAGKYGVRCSGRVFRAQGCVTGLLFGRIGLAGQESLVDEKVAAFEQPRVRGNKIASDQLDNVAGNQLVDRHGEACAVAPYGRLDRHRPAQRLDRILRADFLDEIQRDADRDDGHDDDETRDVAGRRGQCARHEQDDDQRIAEAGQELQPERRTLDGCGGVGSIPRQPRLHLRGSEAGTGRREPREKPVYRLRPDCVWA